MAKKSIYFYVNPRYSPGSPAAVDELTARRVAADEKENYEAALEGIYGAEAREEAARKGLDGIVYARCEKGSTTLVVDLITNTKWVRSQVKIAKLLKGDHIVRSTSVPVGLVTRAPSKPRSSGLGQKYVTLAIAGFEHQSFAGNEVTVKRPAEFPDFI